MVKLVLWTEGLKVKLSGEQGAGLAEYALLLFVVAVAAAGTIATFGDELMAAFETATNALAPNTPPPPP